MRRAWKTIRARLGLVVERPNFATLACVVLLVASYVTPFADLDYTWQVRTGERIVQTGSLRPTDAFTYTIVGQQVPDFEWLYEVVLWAAWSFSGYGGLKLLRLLLVGATLVILAVRLHRDGVARHGIALALLFAVWMLSPAWNLRPLYYTSIGLLLLSGWLHDHCTGRRPLPWGLPLLMLVWANSHPGVITGQGLLVGAIGWEWINGWIGLNSRLDRSAFRRLAVVGGLGLLATFVSPDPLERLLYPFRPELAHPVQRLFVEMQPLHSFLTLPPYTPVGAYILAGLVLLTVVCRFRHYRVWELALLAGLAGLASTAYRSLQDWVLIMLALGVPHLAAMLSEAAPRLLRHKRRTRTWRAVLRVERRCKRLFARPLVRFQSGWLLLTVGLLCVASLIPPVGRRMPRQEHGCWPIAAVDWMEREGLHGRFFAQPGFGAYVAWRLGDRAQTYVDTRGFFFQPEFLEDSNALPSLAPDWPERLERVLARGTDYFLLETSGMRSELWTGFQPYLGAPLYFDDSSVLLSAEQVRRAAAEFIRCHPGTHEPLANAAPLSP
jgi:hypothetical protein